MQNADLTKKIRTLQNRKIQKWAKKFLRLVILKLKKNYRHKSPVPLRDVDIEKELVSNKIYLGEKSYKYFIGYLYNDHKIKPLHILLPKASAYVKSYNRQTK